MKLGRLIQYAGPVENKRPTVKWLDYGMLAEQSYERRRITRKIINGLKEELQDFYKAQDEYVSSHGENGIMDISMGKVFGEFMLWRNSALDIELNTIVTECITDDEIKLGNALGDDALIALGLMSDPDNIKDIMGTV
jgi:hypothetical protein